MKKILATLVLFLLLYGSAFAHQPRIVEEDAGIIEIKNAEFSQAFYATLSGESDSYTLNSDSEFLLLVEVLTPVIAGKEPGIFSVEVKSRESGEVIFTGTTSPNGSIFYEEFVGDEYVEGPKFEETAPAGTYAITVTGDTGKKYVLVTGKREFFPLNEVLNTYKSLPSLKMDFFEKPFYTIFTNPTGMVLLVILGILLIAVLLLYRKISRKKPGNS